MTDGQHIIDVLSERGFIEQTTHEDELREHFDTPGRSCYIGFDPTASSLHIGSLVPIMALAYMQRQGHRPIALVGGGTGLVGDPSGKTEMRQLLTIEDVQRNAVAIRRQLERFIDFKDDRALLVNNADWLTRLEYIPFLRDIGRHFSVNRMIKAESYRMRLESDEGLNFIEFNYMLLQAYDFLELCNRYDCCLQMGGSDQWGNIVAGIELIRRVNQRGAFGITFPLITTATGAKMGKTAAGAVWLDPDRTPPYDYFQYWINTDDADVVRFLALYTFLPMDEIRSLSTLQGEALNAAKTVLAFETTQTVHGREAALKAMAAAANLFGGRTIPEALLPSSTIPRASMGSGDAAMPSSVLPNQQLAAGVPAFKLFLQAGLVDSASAARRLIKQGGAYVNNQRVETFDQPVGLEALVDGQILLRSGKKRMHVIKPGG